MIRTKVYPLVKKFFLKQIVADRENFLESRLKYLNRSFSQEGEDLILRRIFHDTRYGFYVDVGAHHPKRFSNTKIFYDVGWRGINIEPNPELLEEISLSREGDVNLCCGISREECLLEYYFFEEPALNTFSKERAEYLVSNKISLLKSSKQVSTRPLSSILEEVSIPSNKIHFLSIDVEGKDLEVLKSNNWDKFRPSVILIEGASKPNSEKGGELVSEMQSLQYEFFAKTTNTWFFMEQSFYDSQ